MKLIGWSRAPLVVFCLIPSLAFAQLDPQRQALQHYDRALTWMKAGAYLTAIPELERAYALGHDFMVLYDLGQAYLALNQPVYALDALGKYLREGGTRISESQRAKVEAEIARQELRVATVTVVSDVKGAVVRFDGIEVGKTPMPDGLRMNAGTHRLTADAAGFLPWERTVELAGQQRKVINIKLEPDRSALTPAAIAAPAPTIAQPLVPPPAAAPPPSTAVVPQSTPAPTPTVSTSGTDPARPASSSRKTTAYVVGGLGIGALAVGTIFGIRAIAKQQDADDLCPNDRCSTEAVHLNDQAKTAAWVSNFTVGAGLIAVGVATYLLIRSPAPAPSTSVAMRLVPEVGPNQAGVALGGSW